MQKIRVQIGSDVPNKSRVVYVFSFIGLHSGVKFELTEENGDILYGKRKDTSKEAKVIIPCDYSLLEGNSSPETRTIEDIPVLHKDIVPGDKLLEKHESSIRFTYDPVAIIFYLISRIEEVKSTETDTHGRFISTNSVLHPSGFLNEPVVDYHLNTVKRALKDMSFELDDRKTPMAILTHDVDQPIRSIKGSFRLLFEGEKDLKSRVNSLTDTIGRKIKTEDNPFWNFGSFTTAEAGYGFKSAFFFTAPYYRTKYDPKYNVNGYNFRMKIAELTAKGFEVGLHGSYNSVIDGDKLTKEKEKLENTGVNVYGNRSHYLRFEVAGGYRKIQSANLKYDSSLGYSDTIGYRCGTGLPFYPYDFGTEKAIPILEIPLIVMDGALIPNREIEEVNEILDNLVDTALRLNGAVTFLWHLRTAYDIDYPGWFDVYKRLLKKLSENGFDVLKPSSLAESYMNLAGELGYHDFIFE
ncbi:MAG: hypothetical protein GF307_11140 [candidate division Zixibacteria bacterium]|nr:hypothetical protein [candidate division Zixibacteria bacterium]